MYMQAILVDKLVKANVMSCHQQQHRLLLQQWRSSIPTARQECAVPKQTLQTYSNMQVAMQVVLEGKLVNLDVTSPAATLVLGLMAPHTTDAVGFAPTGRIVVALPTPHSPPFRRPLVPPLHPSNISVAMQVVLEGKLVNLDVTSPAATLALGLMFLRTNDAAIAAAFALPDSHFALDYVRPDFVMLRVLAKGLVMQDSVEASRAWVESQMPPLIQVGLSYFWRQNTIHIGMTGWGPAGWRATCPAPPAPPAAR